MPVYFILLFLACYWLVLTTWECYSLLKYKMAKPCQDFLPPNGGSRMLSTFQLKHALMRQTARSQAKIKLAASPFVSVGKFLAAHILPAESGNAKVERESWRRWALRALSPDPALPASAICATTFGTGGNCPRQTLTLHIFSSSKVERSSGIMTSFVLNETNEIPFTADRIFGADESPHASFCFKVLKCCIQD